MGQMAHDDRASLATLGMEDVSSTRKANTRNRMSLHAPSTPVTFELNLNTMSRKLQGNQASSSLVIRHILHLHGMTVGKDHAKAL